MAFEWGQLQDKLQAFFSGRKPVVGLAMGVFDFCHEGHINFLRQAAANCDRLVVGVHTDAEVRSYKGVQPANSGLERKLAVESLGFAGNVVVESDRIALCKKFSVSKIFHGDDWDRQSYVKHFGPEVMDDLGVELVMLSHTPGISSTALRAEVPPVGWWLHSSMEDWSRVHIFDHMKGVFEEVGGIWFLSGAGRDLAKKHFAGAPRFLLEDGMGSGEAARLIADHKLDVLVTAHFNYDAIVGALSQEDNPPELVVLSHGRSGKPGTSADVSLARGKISVDSAGEGESFRRGNMTIHDWSFAGNSYGHLDGFLKRGGHFTNPVPHSPRPKILVLPTWGPHVDGKGLIMGKQWRSAFKELARSYDLILSPHPLLDAKIIAGFAKETGAQVLPAEGKSFEVIPEVQVVIADLSGVLWEALLFDTPVILGCSAGNNPWSADLAPTWDELVKIVPAVQPHELVMAVEDGAGDRRPSQRALGEARLGTIDGTATERTARRVEDLIGNRVKVSLLS